MKHLMGFGVMFFTLSSCVTLDALLPFHGNIPCGEVDETTCDKEDIWDAVCLTCEQEYDWTKEYDWREKTLDTLEGIRPVDTEVVAAGWTTEDGTYDLDAYLIPAHGDEPELADTTIIFNHGRYASIEHYAPRVRFFHELGYTVFVWDYRGYGKSLPTDDSVEPSAPATADWMSDALAAFDRAKELAPNPDRLVIYGMSVGGMPAGEMAYKREACAQVYEAAYNSISAKVETNLALSMPGSFLTTGLVENELKLADTTIPALVIHGDLDDRILIDEVERLYEALPEDLPKEFVTIAGGGHGMGGIGGVPEQGVGAYGDHLEGFFSTHAPDCIGSD